MDFNFLDHPATEAAINECHQYADFLEDALNSVWRVGNDLARDWHGQSGSALLAQLQQLRDELTVAHAECAAAQGQLVHGQERASTDQRHARDAWEAEQREREERHRQATTAGIL